MLLLPSPDTMIFNLSNSKQIKRMILTQLLIYLLNAPQVEEAENAPRLMIDYT